MDKHAWWKWLLLVAMLALSLSRVMPWKEKVRLGLDLAGGISFVVNVDETKIEKEIREDAKPGATEEDIKASVDDALNGALERSIEVLRNRLDQIGIEEPSIVKKADRIEIQLPGIGEDKRQEAEDMILSVGFLEFRMLHERSHELVERLLSYGKAPKGYSVVSIEGRSYYSQNDDNNDNNYSYYTCHNDRCQWYLFIGTILTGFSGR